MRIFVITFAILLTLTACQSSENKSTGLDDLHGNIPLEIAIIADSTHHLNLQTTVKKGAGLQKVMQAIFQVGYGDPAQKFVNALIGVKAKPVKKEFWFLQINGQAAQAGISEIRIEEKTQIVWQLKNY